MNFFHHHRQDFMVGMLAAGKSADDLKSYLTQCGFERAIIALRDPGEILDMRKREGRESQITHCFEVKQAARGEFFRELLGDYLR